MKKDSAFKLKSGNKPSIAKFFGKFAKGKKVTATSGNTVTRGISKPDAKKRPKPMQNLNKAISDALPKGKSKTSKTSSTSKSYTIKKGDTLTKIAKANNTTVDAIMKKNTQIKDKNLIYSGKTLKL